VFRINGAYFTQNEYRNLIEILNTLYMKERGGEKPTIIFDLKGPIPRVGRISTNDKQKCQSVSLKKDQLVKIVHENTKVIDDDVTIYCDKKIAQSMQVGDKIIIDSSDCILKVISVDRYRRRGSISKSSGCPNIRQSKSYRGQEPFMMLKHTKNKLESPSTEEGSGELYSQNYFSNNDFLMDQEDEHVFSKFNNNFTSTTLPTIQEKWEEEQAQQVNFTDHVDLTIEERLKQKQNQMIMDFQNIIKKHKDDDSEGLCSKKYNTTCELWQIKRGSEEELKVNFEECNNQCKDEYCFLKSENSSVNLNSGLQENRERGSYFQKREKLRGSMVSTGEKMNNMILCEVLNPGIIHLYKKLFVLEKEITNELGLSTNPICAKDIVDLSASNKLGVNIIMAVVNNVNNIKELREISGDENLKIFARIETSEAIYNFDSILNKADGVIIQHGLLSSKIPYEDVTLLLLISSCV
jgi:hypothetical protein